MHKKDLLFGFAVTTVGIDQRYQYDRRRQNRCYTLKQKYFDILWPVPEERGALF